jgi:Tol biopolymer transport system component
MKIILHSYIALLIFGISFNCLADSTGRISVSTAGTEADGNNNSAIISGDGSAVVFASDAANLVNGDTNAATDIFVRDMRQNTTTRVSVNSAGEQANGLTQLSRKTDAM